ncbi:TPA: 30S ribosomal protein S17e [Candidatus Woesearchaeota archaeon]|nr:30S ribosomal protein S17e [archaeon]HIJ10889.1 30S ribosomal protein S17e [Candidatus Woesearchaeota archaeon]
MGRIKTKFIKRKTRELNVLHGDSFTSDFDANKKLTDKHVKVYSKKLRNIIAGYMTRLKKKEA